MKAVFRNNAPVAAILFLSWVAINWYRLSVPAWGALLALAIFFLAFFGASYLALRDAGRSLLWAMGWFIVTVAVSALVIMSVPGLGFSHI